MGLRVNLDRNLAFDLDSFSLDYSRCKHKTSIPARHVEQDQGVAGHLQKKSETRLE